jgi:hypothetical protein
MLAGRLGRIRDERLRAVAEHMRRWLFLSLAFLNSAEETA